MRDREEVYGMLREAVDLQETWRYAYDRAKAQGCCGGLRSILPLRESVPVIHERLVR